MTLEQHRPHVARVDVVDRLRSTEFKGWVAEYFECGHATFTVRGAIYDRRDCRRCSAHLPRRPRAQALCNAADEGLFA